MTNHEERKLLLAAAAELHAALREVAPRMNEIINRLISAADDIALDAANEVSAGTQRTVRKLTYGKTQVYDVPDDKLVSGVKTFNDLPIKLTPGKRSCSLCRQPGHQARNCPNAHLIQAQKKAAVAARPVKKTRGPVSPERRAQLVANLAKARASRGKKGK